MTTYEFSGFADRRPAPALAGGIRRVLDLVVRHRRRRQTLQSIAHLDVEHLQDIGLDPEAVADAMDGDCTALWDRIERFR